MNAAEGANRARRDYCTAHRDETDTSNASRVESRASLLCSVLRALPTSDAHSAFDIRQVRKCGAGADARVSIRSDPTRGIGHQSLYSICTRVVGSADKRHTRQDTIGFGSVRLKSDARYAVGRDAGRARRDATRRGAARREMTIRVAHNFFSYIRASVR